MTRRTFLRDETISLDKLITCYAILESLPLVLNIDFFDRTVLASTDANYGRLQRATSKISALLGVKGFVQFGTYHSAHTAIYYR